MSYQNHLSRRGLFRSLASCAALGSLGSLAAVSQQARAAASERKFLFFFAEGGWDPTPLDPKFGADGVSAVGGTDMDPGTFLGQAGNLTYSAGDDRPNMDLFFQNWGQRAALVRGVNVHSVAHDTATQWMMTGSTSMTAPDWPTILASSGGSYPMPHLVFSGPNFPGRLGAAVVRGGGGSLLQLIDGSLLSYADTNSPQHALSVDSMIDAHVHRQGVRYQQELQGLAKVRADAFIESLNRGSELEGRQFEAGLGASQSGTLDQALMALEVMRLGLTRCAMIQIPGSWDTHGGNGGVGPQLDDFFGVLDQVMDHCNRTPGFSQSWLADEVTIVCASELGRTPMFNGAGGRDHWTYASMMMMGSGIRGDTVAGATTDSFIARECDFGTGQPSASGGIIGTENVGAALLQLGGADASRYLPGVAPLTAIIEGE